MPNNDFWGKDAVPVAQNDFWGADAKPIASTAAPEVVQEMPDIEGLWKSRLTVKNLGNDTASSVAYLQKQHPDAEFSIGAGDQILAKKKGDTKWGVLDPNTPILSMATLKDLPQDIGDIGYDVLGGTAQGVATAAGGLAAGLPGAMAGGSASGAGIEAIRQKLGQMAGVNKDVNLGDVGVSAAIGAAAPLVFGTGAGAKDAAKYLSGEGGSLASKLASAVRQRDAAKIIGETAGKALTQADKDLALRELINQQSGWLGRMGKAALPAMTGTTSEEAASLAKKLPEIDKIYNEGIDAHLEEKAGDLVKGLSAYQKDVRDRFGEAIQNAKGDLDISDVYSKLAGHVDALKQKAESGAKFAKSDYQDAAAIIENYLKRDVIDPVTGETKRAVVTTMSPQDLMDLKNALSSEAEFSAKGGVKSLEGRPPVSQQTIGAVRDFIKGIGGKIDSAVDDVAKTTGNEGIRSEYRVMKDIQREFEPLLRKDPVEGVDKLLTKYSKQTTRGTQRRIENMGQRIGFDIANEADTLRLAKKFAEPAWTPVSGGGATSTGKVLGIRGLATAAAHGLGALAGLPQAVQFMAGEAGGTVAGFAASPAMQKAIARGKSGAVAKGLAAGVRGLSSGVGRTVGAVPGLQNIAPYAEDLTRSALTQPIYPANTWFNMYKHGGEK